MGKSQRCPNNCVLAVLGVTAAAILAMVVYLGVTKLGGSTSSGNANAGHQADDFGGSGNSVVLTFAPTVEPTSMPTVTPGSPTKSPTFPPPTSANNNLRQPSQPASLTYSPGDLSVEYDGLLLSTGLVATLVAEADSLVPYANGAESVLDFEQDPKGGATFPLPNGGWIYVVDFARGNDRGGVGALTFNADGRVTDYRMLLEDTNDNRHGTPTPWGTYLSVENIDDDGSIYEVDPTGVIRAERTLLGSAAGRSAWTGVAVDNRRSNSPVFFVSSNQDEEGFVFRYKPSQAAINAHLFSEPAFHLLQEDAAPTAEYLVLVPTPEDPSRGFFTWIDDADVGKDSAIDNFASISDVDAYDGVLYVTSEERKELFVLDLDNEEYTSASTEIGEFDGDPASVLHILSGHESRRRRARQLHAGHAHGGGGSAGFPADLPYLYLTEDGNDNEQSGIFARNADGQYAAIVVADDRRGGDASSLAFSPSLKQMFFAMKGSGKVYMVERQDGESFDSPVLATSYIEE